jgi:hypothetical protein
MLLKSGVLVNWWNELSHRLARNTTRASTSGKCNPSGSRWRVLACLACLAHVAPQSQIVPDFCQICQTNSSANLRTCEQSARFYSGRHEHIARCATHSSFCCLTRYACFSGSESETCKFCQVVSRHQARRLSPACHYVNAKMVRFDGHLSFFPPISSS